MKTAKSAMLGHRVARGPDDDWYATDMRAPAMLFLGLDGLGVSLPAWCVEPSVGDGPLARVAMARGHRVLGYDIVDRGWPGTVVTDFLRLPRPVAEPMFILQNPPYTRALDHIRHSLHILREGEWCLALLRIQFLESQERQGFFRECPPRFVMVFSRRIACNRHGEALRSGSAVCYAWFCWQKGYAWRPEITWL